MGFYETAVRRWQGVGPYYAMFPTSFADSVIAGYTRPGDTVLDPFAGRGTAIFSAAHQGRQGVGIEINPVGWLYGRTKLQPASKAQVTQRYRDLGSIASSYHSSAEALPTFFRYCFAERTREFLMAARETLDWRSSLVDGTVMALLLVYLHGKYGAALSNQMRQTKAMAPDYAVRWWSERGLTPPDLNPVEFLIRRLDWRYAKGTPVTANSEMCLGDSELSMMNVDTGLPNIACGVRLLFTSPPYFSRTNYHYDQWLRLWLLGGPPNALRVPGSTDVRGKFENAGRYRKLLQKVFGDAAVLMARDSAVYVRTGADKVTFEITLSCLREVFPGYSVNVNRRPYFAPTQTRLFGDSSTKAGEVDIVMTSRRS